MFSFAKIVCIVQIAAIIVHFLCKDMSKLCVDYIHNCKNTTIHHKKARFYIIYSYMPRI